MALFSGDAGTGNYGNRGSRTPEGDAANALWNAFSQLTHQGGVGGFHPQGMQAQGMSPQSPHGGGVSPSPSFQGGGAPQGIPPATGGMSVGGSMLPAAGVQSSSSSSGGVGGSGPAMTPSISGDDDPERRRATTQGV